MSGRGADIFKQSISNFFHWPVTTGSGNPASILCVCVLGGGRGSDEGTSWGQGFLAPF